MTDLTLPLEASDIQKIIPHRFPFLLVDRVIEIDPGKRAVGIKNVSIGEPFFQGHFPDYPVMPGVLIVEAIAQVGAVAMLQLEEYHGRIAFFAGIDNVRFKRQVKPGDAAPRGRARPIRRNIGTGTGTATVDGEVACKGEFMFVIAPGGISIIRRRADVIGIDASRALPEERTGTETYSFELCTPSRAPASGPIRALFERVDASARPAAIGRSGSNALAPVVDAPPAVPAHAAAPAGTALCAGARRAGGASPHGRRRSRSGLPAFSGRASRFHPANARLDDEMERMDGSRDHRHFRRQPNGT